MNPQSWETVREALARSLPYRLFEIYAAGPCTCSNPRCPAKLKGPRSAWMWCVFDIGSEAQVTWWLGMN